MKYENFFEIIEKDNNVTVEEVKRYILELGTIQHG